MATESLETALKAHEAEVQKVNDTLDALIAGIQTAPRPENLGPRDVGGPYRACKEFVDKLLTVEKRLKEIKRITLEHQVNIYWAAKLQKKYDLADYEAKRAVVSEFNKDLRDYGCVIRHPETGAPCTLLASSSPDGKGRYVLSDKLTKKRSNTSVTLLDLLPLRLMPEPKRREGFIEARKKKPRKKES